MIKKMRLKKRTQPKETKGNRQIKQENKILRNLLIGIGIFIVILLAGYLFLDNIRNFGYKGVDFQTVSFCDTKPCLVLYQTTFPVLHNGEVIPYNIFLRNHPNDLDKIPFNGSMNLYNELVMESPDDFNCNGDGIISIANVMNFYRILEVNVFKNETLKCDENAGYTYINIIKGDETRIDQTGWSCYDISINNCEILEGTERFLLESFVDVNELLLN
jgi:hypothetical protein